MDETTREILALLVVIGLGLVLGRIAWRGVSLGAAGVLFVALAAGQFGFQVPRLAGVAGVVLFVYCLGLGAGPSFVRMLVERGKALAILGVIMIGSAGAAAWLVGRLLGLTPDLTSGLLAGALTSTPALAAASEHLPGSSQVALGFGIAYPLGVIGVILFVQLAPRILRRGSEASGLEGGDTTELPAITRVLVEVLNPGMAGRRLRDVRVLAHANCRVSRVLVGSALLPLPADFQLELGQKLLLIGAASRIDDVVEALGRRCEGVDYTLDTERQRRQVIVTSRELVGKSLSQLRLLSRFGVTVVRVHRHDIEFVPGLDEKFQFADALTVVGNPDDLRRFTQYAGHKERTADETDLVSLMSGLALGVLAGQVRLNLGSEAFALGMAGGPLLVGLLLGHFGRIGPLVGYMPRAARLLLSEIGLALFLADAGAQAGAQLLPVLKQQGFALCLGAAAILVVPLVTGFVVARWLLKLEPLEMLGGICGAMTSTPALGVISSSVDSSRPATSYATIYPLALILMTLAAPLLIQLLQTRG